MWPQIQISRVNSLIAELDETFDYKGLKTT